jgi:hypothetical protein
MVMEVILKLFTTKSLFDASSALLGLLKIQFNRQTAQSMRLTDLYDSSLMSQELKDASAKLASTFFIGVVNDKTLQGSKDEGTIEEEIAKAQDTHYQGMVIFAVEAKEGVQLKRNEQAIITRAFNRIMHLMPVTLFIKEGNLLSLATCERTQFKQEYRSGEKLGRVIILRHVDCEKPNRAHLDILSQLGAEECTNFDNLYRKWMTEFDISLLNKQFYKELQDWFYWAVDEIELPRVVNSNQDDDQQAKNFILRMLSRLMFCWFIKERGLIEKQLLELTDFNNHRYPIVKDVDNENFLDSNSYYRGILQNMFFNGLNKQKKSSKKDFKCTSYLPGGFDYNRFLNLPFLNCGTFDPLEEDFNKESIEDDVMSVPNRLFYGDDEHKGINQIFCSYHFTIEENTPLDIDIALDPEMLGLVFENLLAEIDPNNDDATTKSIRKATGSYYTPRPVIQSMVNESLLVYLKKRIRFDADEKGLDFLTNLIYHDVLKDDRHNRQIVECLSDVRALDPACGSGAFPMGMLQRIVDLLKIVDPGNKLWLDMMLEPIKDRTVRENFKKQLACHQDDYSRKLGIIQNCIYGIDIQPIAVQITKLRFFISLLIDQQTDKHADNAGVTPLPNLETKIVCADSLKSLSADVFEEELKAKMILEREKYYQPDVTSDERKEIAGRIADMMDILYPTFAIRLGMKQVSNKAILKKWFMTGSVNAPFFDMKTFFPEVESGFDIVIGNPPYGGFKIDDKVKEKLGLGNKDPYGAFIARFLGNGYRVTPLKNGGVLSFIVSDTFMTIGTHLKLRQQMMHNKIYKMVRMSPKTFSATVNTVVIVCEKCKADTTDSAIEGNICQMADMSNIDIHEDFEHFMDILSRSTMQMTNVANEEYAIYNYEQKLIKNCSNLPFFVASPKLFGLMNDKQDNVERGVFFINEKQKSYRRSSINGKNIRLVNLGTVSETMQGLATGDNDAYMYQNPDARGNYRDIKLFVHFILTEDDLRRIQSDESLRLAIIKKGITKDDKSSDRYFGGRYITPYDKGGESDIDEGWVPNYFVPTNYYIDWSEWAVNRMKTMTIADRIREKKEKKKITPQSERSFAAVIRNPLSYFKPAINVSRVGMYSPTFRVSSNAPYDSGCNNIFTDLDTIYLMGILCSKLYRFLFINYVNGTVNSQTDDHLLLPIVVDEINGLKEKVEAIIKKQHEPGNLRYDYASHEQIEIDKLVYDAYGLNDDDINEVETWFARRYPKLVAAQRSNLEKLKKA